MKRPNLRNSLSVLAIAAGAVALIPFASASLQARPVAEGVRRLPPLAGAPATAPSQEQTVVLAGGCFWGVQGVFAHVKGVKQAISGYAGGAAATAHYQVVGTGATGHAEAVKVVFDPSVVSYGEILRIFFSVATDPTQLNRQFPDEGTQYRSEIFVSTPEQEAQAKAYMAQLNQAKAFASPIVTKVAPLKGFFPAEDYHQNYLTLHPEQPYIATYDLPKVAALKSLFPEAYRATPLMAPTGRS